MKGAAWWMLPLVLLMSDAAGLGSEPREASTSFRTDQDLNRWMSFYYVHRDTEAVVGAVREMFRRGWFDRESARPPLVAFLSSIFYQNQKQLEPWLAELDPLGLEQKKYLWLAMDWSGSSQAETLLRRLRDQHEGDTREFLETLIQEENRPLVEMDISEPLVLDILWGQFVASGDERCVQKVIGALHGLDGKGDVNKMLIGGAARWSLATNAKDHARVLEICKREVTSESGVVRKALNQIIREAESKGKKAAREA